MSQVYNFSAGPAVLPRPVLEQAQAELLDWQGTGISVMEMSHRGKHFTQIAEQAEQDLRELLNIPDGYKVLFLQGGASLQFSMLSMNLAQRQVVDYVDTGDWSAKAIKSAQAANTANTTPRVRVVASAKSEDYTHIPEPATWQRSQDAAYLHYTPNETMRGVEFHWIPDVGDTPLIADMSSTILSRPLDVRRFAMIYAGAQKNIGPAGLTLVIIREDMLRRCSTQVPDMLSYAVMADKGSMLNTPPTYAWYLAGLVFQWLKQQGGLSALAERNWRQSNMLYRLIDELDFYHNPVEPACRSWMNIPFTLKREALESEFLQQAERRGLVALKGHRDMGGMRASLYNAMPDEGVQALCGFMRDFAQQHG